jgi:hypothetical protein
MVQQKKEDQPDYEVADYGEMKDNWRLVQDLYTGVTAIRKSDVKHLKQFEREDDESYKNRLDEADLYNVFGESVDTDVGMVFNESILPTKIPEALEELFRDIDLCGSDLETFLRELFRTGVRDGHSFLFVDAPPPVESEEGADVTLDMVSGHRPFWVHYRADQIVNWRTRMENGRETLEQVSIREVTTEPDGEYGEKEVTKYRVLKNISGNISYSLFRKVVENKVTTWEPEAEDVPIIGPDHIPLYPFYGQKEGFFKSSPPRLNLAETNKKHLNKNSLLDYTLTFIKPIGS